MIAIITGTDEFQRFAAADAGLYQRFFSLKIAQILSVLVGAVVQAESNIASVQSSHNAERRVSKWCCSNSSLLRCRISMITADKTYVAQAAQKLITNPIVSLFNPLV